MHNYKAHSMRSFIFIILTIFYSYSNAQVGGTNVFEFLDISTNARVSGLGGNNISVKDSELGIACKAPSLLDSTYNNTFCGTRAGHFEGATSISHGLLAYANKFKGYNYIVGMNYINYGFFDGYNEYGEDLGSFSANDFLFQISAAKEVYSHITAGVSVKPIFSQLETYKSLAIATDYSATYNDTSKLFTATLLVRNFGTQIKPYTKDNYEPMPWGIDIGATKKLRHAPLRLSLTYHDIQSFDTYYEKPKTTNTLISDEEAEESKFSKFSNDLLAHFIVGAEILLFKNLFVATGYNFKKRQELVLADASKMIGFSFGVGLKIYKFHLSYGHEQYHIAGGTNVFSVRTDLNEFRRKKPTPKTNESIN